MRPKSNTADTMFKLLRLFTLMSSTIAFIVPTAADATGSYLWERMQHNETNNYARVVELQHAGMLNGRLLATWEHHYTRGPQSNESDRAPGNFIVRQSDDHGVTWETLATVSDTQTTDGHPFSVFYQPFIFEYPQKLGKYPPGTLLLVGNLLPANCSEFSTEFFAWRSADHGKTWDSLGVWQRGTSQGGIWEPFLYLDDQGRLIAMFSDERDHQKHSQMLVHVTSEDGGDTWSTPTGDVVSHNKLDRPGMATVAKMGNGEYIMSYEVCYNYCRIHVKTSPDGSTWDAADLGTAVATADGLYPAQSPYTIWDVSTKQLVVSSQAIRYQLDDSTTEEQNRAVFTNTAYGAGNWSWSPSPWTVGADAPHCANYSPHLLSAGDGVVRYTAPAAEGRTHFCSERTGAAPIAALPYRADFLRNGQAGWINFAGNWTVIDSVYEYQSEADDAVAVTGSSGWGNYNIRANIMISNSSSTAGLSARVSASDTGQHRLKGYTATINASSSELAIWRYNDRATLLYSKVHPGGIRENLWYRLSLSVNSTRLTATLRPSHGESPTSLMVMDSSFRLDVISNRFLPYDTKWKRSQLFRQHAWRLPFRN